MRRLYKHKVESFLGAKCGKHASSFSWWVLCPTAHWPILIINASCDSLRVSNSEGTGRLVPSFFCRNGFHPHDILATMHNLSFDVSMSLTMFQCNKVGKATGHTGPINFRTRFGQTDLRACVHEFMMCLRSIDASLRVQPEVRPDPGLCLSSPSCRLYSRRAAQAFL